MCKRFIVVVFMLSFALTNAQTVKDTLYLMNGKTYGSNVLDTLLGGVTILDPKDSTKRFTIDNDDLYSVKYANGAEYYYYSQDTAVGNEFTRDEMRYFMKGERDAKRGFKARGSLLGSFVAGFAGGLTGSIIGPVAPFAYVGLCGLTKVKIKHNTVSDPYLLDHDPYILGYERQARAKRRIQSLIGGGIGLIAGYATNFALAKTNNYVKFTVFKHTYKF